MERCCESFNQIFLMVPENLEHGVAQLGVLLPGAVAALFSRDFLHRVLLRVRGKQDIAESCKKVNESEVLW